MQQQNTLRVRYHPSFTRGEEKKWEREAEKGWSNRTVESSAVVSDSFGINCSTGRKWRRCQERGIMVRACIATRDRWKRICANLRETCANATVHQTEVTPLRILLCSSGIYVIGGHRDRHFLHFFLLAEQFFCSTLKRRARSEDAHGKTRGACPLDGRLCCSDAFTDESDSHTGCCSFFPFVNIFEADVDVSFRDPSFFLFDKIKCLQMTIRKIFLYETM